ncbi:M48 family metallopeptidase [Amycolatopsis tolypomycina]|uniref:M48 family metallopeptidase n=1 Tax=Amycolatopsis tolypomycina TaxID=208445 RepID=UPI000B881675|nr:SprT family zinc-dependent metalloprotease [Amycolatopsis tolypomycina]
MSLTVQSALASLPMPREWTWRVVVRPRRRTLGIEVQEDGGLLFAVPPDADPQAVADAVLARLSRLADEVSSRKRRGGQPIKALVGGAGFAYLGRHHRLKVITAEPGRRVRLHQGWLELPDTGSPHQGARLIAEWYAARGSRWVTARVAPLAERTGVTPREVVVRELGERWGACAPDGSIALHWALMQLPTSLVDLVLVHELTHLKVPAHGAAFRHRMRMVLGDLESLERRFALAEPDLWRGAV